MTFASAKLRLGSSSSSALVSSFGVGLPVPHLTSRSVTSEGSTSSLACAIQRVMNFDTVCSRSTFSTSA